MKKDSIFLVVVLLVLLISVVGLALDPVVNFPDENLEQAIRVAIAKPSGDIYASDLAALTTLDAAGKDIVNLEGIEYCANLLYLFLNFNQISDLGPLSALKKLSRLHLRFNRIVSLGPLSGLTKLSFLRLGNNQIIDVNPLSGLTGLLELMIESNQISDIRALSGLTRPQSLNLSNNQVIDISDLSGLTSLTGLYLEGNRISSIAPLTGLTNLTALALAGNQISNIAPLPGLTKLARLYLGRNQISNITDLSGLVDLQELSLRENQISDISVLSGLTNLQELSLHTNQISDISALSGLANLQELSLHTNQISDISALSGLANLTDLNFCGNQISDIGPLTGLTELTALYLHFNQISDIGPLVANPGIGAGDTVGIKENWLCLTLGSEDMNDIDVLLARGVDVSHSNQCFPFGLSAVAVSATRIELQWYGLWVRFEDGFRIERKKEGDTYSEIATVGPDVSTYSDAGLDNLTTYCYRVRAYNAGGETCYTNEACETTPVSPPVTEFSYAPDCVIAGAEIAFTDASTDDGAVVAWAWDFGDGSTSSEQHPLHSFAAFGSYTVMLRVTDNDGATDETSQVVRVYLRGDLNGDDLVDLIDVLMLYRHVDDGLDLDACQRMRADIDDDGDVDEDDAQALADRVFAP